MLRTTQIVGVATLLIGSVTLALALQAQPIYRCANNYSQTRCPGGTEIEVDDSRSPAQKARSDAATVQALRLANEMEKSRLKGESVAGKNAKPPVASTKTATPKGTAAKHGRGQKDSQPGPFVAFAPPQEKPVARKSDGVTAKP